MKKIILAFSGGLDTSFCIPYLQEKNYEVITATVNTGGFSSDELIDIEKRSKELGAIKHITIDAQTELYERFAGYIIKGNYMKGGVYPACVGPERILVAEKLAKIALAENCITICHGSTGAGNDQVRFDLALRANIPHCEIIAPIREHGFSREEEVHVLEKKGFSVDKIIQEYSINIGILGTTIGGKETYDSRDPLPDSAFPSVSSIQNAPENPEILEIQFEKGLPVSLNGKTQSGIEIIKQLSEIGAKHAVGKEYHIGTTIIGIKARIGFEAPSLHILIKAHSELEKIILSSKQLFWKNHLGNVYGDMVHEGLYYDPVVKDLEAMFDSSNENVNGTVKIQLHKGNISIVSLESENSQLGNNGTYGELTGGWNGRDAEGFCTLYGMETRKLE